MPWICSRPFGSMRGRTATPTGRSSWTIALCPPRRSAVSFSTCTKKTRRCGRPPTPCARRCRSSIICRTAARTIGASTASICRSIRSAAHGASVEMLDAPKAPPALRGALAELARRTSELVARGAPLIPQIRDVRLGAEIAAIHALARRLARDLESRDPLSERVHLGKAGFALVGGLARRAFSRLRDDALGRGAGESDGMSSQAAPVAHSSFYTALRILPEKQREGMFAVYGFCREVDDIADDRGPATAAERLAKLEQLARRHRRDGRRTGAGPSRRARRGDPSLSFEARRFRRRDRRHGDGRRAGYPRSGLGDAGPLLRSRGVGRRPAFGAHFRPA